METETYKATLTTMLASITEELSTIGVHDPENDANWEVTAKDFALGKADPNIVADQVEDWDQQRSTLAALEARFNNIRRALGKIEAGTFGVCEISGEEIEADRLDANPAARTCKAHINEEATLPL